MDTALIARSIDGGMYARARAHTHTHTHTHTQRERERERERKRERDPLSPQQPPPIQNPILQPYIHIKEAPTFAVRCNQPKHAHLAKRITDSFSHRFQNSVGWCTAAWCMAVTEHATPFVTPDKQYKGAARLKIK